MRHGFSLVELSIVLVILGLLTGGILAGQSLIRAAELRSVSTEYSKYMTAGKAFRDKYFALPGDMANATKFWGTDPNCPGTAPAQARTGIATCDGDGDNIIYHVSAGGARQHEGLGFWQHLANAGLIEGQYSGVGYTFASPQPYMGTQKGGFNVPFSRLPNAVWGVFTMGSNDASSTTMIEGAYGHTLFLGADTGSGGNTANCCSFKPEEAWNVDTKLDDGKPGSGTIVIHESQTACYLLANGSAGATSTTAARTDITYNLANSALACALMFKNAL